MFDRSLHVSRRGLIGGASGFAALAAAGCAGQQQMAATPSPKCGIQLYTMRSLLQQDIRGTLMGLGAIGYKEAEGYGDLNPPVAELKSILNDAGIVMPSAHISRDRIRDNPAPEVERAAAMGYEYAVLNWLAPEERDSIDKFKAWADTANAFAESCRAVGVKFCWHNHDFEFTPIDGVLPFDVLWERCDPALVKFEVDLYWAAKAGVDLPAFFATHAQRVVMVHVKDMAADGAMADVGQGTIDFAGLFAAHRFEHYYVERDDAPAPMENAATSYQALSAILKALPA
jgi:sugar phosphate isomerase/epimerase